MLSLQRELDFSGFGGRSCKQKSSKNLSKNETEKGLYFGINFLSIFLDFLSQVGLLGASWEPLGGILAPLEAPWERIGSVLDRLGASWCVLARPRGVLEAPWRRFGPQEKPV